MTKSPRAFQVLAELGVRPAVTYLARSDGREERRGGGGHGDTHERRLGRPASAVEERDPRQPRPDYGEVTSEIAAPDGAAARDAAWWVAFLVAASVLALGVVLIGYTMSTGIGVWGLNRTVGWGYDITNFVFWVGIGHAGTLISAILLLLRQQLAHLDRPRGRGDDDLRGPAARRSSRSSTWAGPGSPSGCSPTPTARGLALGELPLAARLGRLRDLDVLHGLAALLVPRPHPRLRDPARPERRRRRRSSTAG